jgi:predicted SPOUT superfamily RNA methylase MTH1
MPLLQAPALEVETSHWHGEDREGTTTKMKGATTTKTMGQNDTTLTTRGPGDKRPTMRKTMRMTTMRQ